MKKYKNLETLISQLFNLKPLLPGTVTKQYRICGKPNCRCIDKENPQKHLAFQFSYTLENKKSTVYVKKVDVEVAKKMTDSYKEMRKIITAISLETVQLTRKYGATEASNIMVSCFESARNKALRGKPESGKFIDAKISRDSWKKRALKRKKELDKRMVTIRDLADSRKKWRTHTLELRKEKIELEKVITEQREKINKLELKQQNNLNKVKELTPSGFTYSVATIRYAILMVVFSLNSLRGSALNFKFFSNVLKQGLPSWIVIRNWVLRFGLYKLLKPLPKRKDWIWIVDHTIEFGTKKCMVVLAISREHFEKNKYQLCHKDMEVAAIDIQEKATGENINKTLENLSKEIGKPQQIVSDNCRNIKKGIRLFKEKSKQTIDTYDITHKVANELKYLLENNERWKQFTQKMRTTKREGIFSEFMCIAPRKPKEKSRWLNLDQDLEWAENILENKPKPRPGRLTKKQKKFRKIYGWLEDFKEDITEWCEFLDIINIAKKEVKWNGLNKKSSERFAKGVKKIGNNNAKAKQLKENLKEFFDEEVKQFPKKEITLLGTSDIIESVFGKYKIFSAKTPLKEIGKSILTIPILTSEVTIEEVKKAMETITNEKLSEWARANLGESIFSKRKKIFAELENKKCSEEKTQKS